MFPSGRIGTARAKARPSRGVANVRTAASVASPTGQNAGKNASVEETQPAKSAARTAGASFGTNGGSAGSERTAMRGRATAGRVRRVGARRSAAASLAAAGRLAGSIARAESTSRTSGLARSGRAEPSEGAPRPIRFASSRNGALSERVAPSQRLPEQDTGRPHVGGRVRRVAREPFRRDVRERSRHVTRGGERLLLADERQAEVEDAYRDVRAVDEQHVGRLDVAVDDAACVRMREALENLGCRLDGGGVIELAAFERMTERATGNVLVRDVDVPLVARERVGTQTSGMLELGRGGRFPLRARSGGSCAGDDLERDLAILPRVEGVPDRSHPAAAERPERPVPVEDEGRRGSVSRGLAHPCDTFSAGRRSPLGAEEWATVRRIPLQRA